MILAALILVPALAGLASFKLASDSTRRVVLALSALAHLLLTLSCWVEPPGPAWNGWLELDQPGLLVLTTASVLFLAGAVYSAGYLAREARRTQADADQTSLLFVNAPEATFTGCLLIFLSTMTLSCVSQHLGLLWVAIEGTTLASAPLIYFHRHRRSLEATWKYLLLCSVGIALALLGNFFLSAAASSTGGNAPSLLVSDFVERGPRLNATWVKIGFIFLLVGYGTKAGFAPLQAWLPDAYSEAPSLVAALLSGALANAAFLGVLRAQQVCDAAGLASFGHELLLFFGLFSMAFAAVFMLSQTDYKRMLAYSSVENMGILATGIGLSGIAATGAFLHVFFSPLLKGALFLLSGNILKHFRVRTIEGVRGAVTTLPISGPLWIATFLAATGAPPFATFFSEWLIFKGALDAERYAVAGLFLFLLTAIFIAMGRSVLKMSLGAGTPPPPGRAGGEPYTSFLPPLLLWTVALALSLFLPVAVRETIAQAARLFGGHS